MGTNLCIIQSCATPGVRRTADVQTERAYATRASPAVSAHIVRILYSKASHSLKIRSDEGALYSREEFVEKPNLLLLKISTAQCSIKIYGI